MKEYGLIGRNISHSFSANYFNNKFIDEKIDASYTLYDIDNVEEFFEIILKNPLIEGLNVTSPFKRDVIPYLHSLSETARSLNAVNVIKIERNDDGSAILKGFNTDSEGFRKTLKPFIPLIKGKRAFIFGTGGAASAVALALRNEKIYYNLVSRNPENDTISYEEASNHISECGLLVNATPLGMGKEINKCVPLNYGEIQPGQVCYDLIYNPKETLFLKKGKDKGATIVNGLQMLINQAELAWKIWNGNSQVG